MMFKKAAIFTDIHFGLKSNSDVHNEDCLEFIRWMISQSKDCDTCIFLGDWHNNRNAVNLSTLSYSLRGLELLSVAYDQVFIIPGNHDLYYRQSRDIHGIEWSKHIKNISIINELTTVDGMAFVPWVLPGDKERITSIRADFVFGHFELPNFFMNSLVVMPDHGTEVKAEHFKNSGTVFTGHFHKRQSVGNINYIGNCFPHNFSDVNDDARGFVKLSPSGSTEYLTWPDQPTFRAFGLEHLLMNAESILTPKMHCKVTVDTELSYEDAIIVKDHMIATYGLREFKLIKPKEETTNVAIQQEFQSVEQIVNAGLMQLDTKNVDIKRLQSIWMSL